MIEKLLRHPITLLLSFLVFLASASFATTRLFLPEYLPWQLLQTTSALILAAGILLSSFAGAWLWRSSREAAGVSFKHAITVAFSKAIPTYVFIGGLVLSWSGVLVLPAAENPASLLQQKLQCPPSEMANATEYRNTVAKMPRFKGSRFIAYADVVLSYWPSSQSGHFKDADFHDFLNSLDFSICDDPSATECRAWLTLIEADAKLQIRKTDEARELYEKLLGEKSLGAFFRAYAYRGLGYISATSDNFEEAYKDWTRSLEARPTWGTYQNLGLYHERKNEFEIGEKLESQAVEAFENQKKSTLCSVHDLNEEEATLRENLANFYRDYALDAKSKGRSAGLRTKAISEIRLAQKAYPSYVESYWTEAHIQIAFGQYSDARLPLRAAAVMIKNPAEADLQRLREYGYLSIGLPYTAWIELRTYWHEGRLDSKQASLAAKQIPGFEDNPYGAIEQVLDETQRRGYTVDDDRSDVKKMRHYLSAVRTTLE